MHSKKEELRATLRDLKVDFVRVERVEAERAQWPAEQVGRQMIGNLAYPKRAAAGGLAGTVATGRTRLR